MNEPNVVSYVVRIYERGPSGMVGVVEIDAPGDCVLSHSFAELLSIRQHEGPMAASVAEHPRLLHESRH